MIQTLTHKDFADFFGVDQLDSQTAQSIDQGSFGYRQLPESERDSVILTVLQALESGQFDTVSEQRRSLWERNWSSALQRFTEEQHLDAIVPPFFKPITWFRLYQNYVAAVDPRIELDFLTVLRTWIHHQFLQDCHTIYEFGAGSAYHLVQLHRIAKQHRLVGLDWSESAVRLTNEIAERYQLPLSGQLFDLYQPSHLDINSRDAALTVCSLEQVGSRFEPFVDWLVDRRPRVCVHVEPIVDYYDPGQLPDQLAIRYHRSRGYLSGFVDHLNRLESRGRIKILHQRRVPFGSLFHEGYSIVAWCVV